MLAINSFKTKIFLIFIIISFIPLVLIFTLNLLTVIETRQKNIAEIQNLAIENSSAEILKLVNQEIGSLNLVVSGATTADGRAASSLSEIDANNLIFLISKVKDATSDVIEINFVDKDGLMLRIDQDGLIAARPSLAFDENLQYKNIQVLPEINSELAKTSEFQAAVNTAFSGKNYIGPVAYSKAEPIMRLASQIENQNKETIGVIVASVKLGNIQKIITQTRLGKNGFLYLTDGLGRLIIGPADKFASLGEVIKEPPMVADVIRGNTHNGLIKFETYTDSFDKQMIFAGRPIEQVGWYIFSEWPKNDAFSVINDILLRSSIVVIVTLFLVTILSLFLTRQVVKPIKILSEGAKQISEGNLNYQVKLKTNDEFELVGEKFNEMAKVLEENKKLKDEFVFIAAHELRAPVTAIKGFLSMILDGSMGKLPAKINQSLITVNSANERLVQLIQDLLEIARSENNKMVIELQQIEISIQIKAIISQMESLAQAKGIRIKYEQQKEILVMADNDKLKEVLVNLISNAIKYTLTSGEITIYHEIKDGMAVTSVKDQGMGISPENQQKLFSKFYRVKTDQTAKIEGTGLGLFICKEIMERMGGKIWLSSEVGKGSIFSFSLKMA